MLVTLAPLDHRPPGATMHLRAFRFLRRLDAGGITALLLAVAHLWRGVSLLAQPVRWVVTPAFSNLFVFIPAEAWGTVHVVAGLLVLGGVFFRARRFMLLQFGLSVMIALSVGWLFAFLLAYFFVPGALPYASTTSVLELWMLYRTVVWHRHVAVSEA